MISKHPVNQRDEYESKEPPMYKGKALVYLDHNVLNKFVKNKMQSLFNQLKEKFQVVYSRENLKEILRSGDDYSKKFLDVLIELDAWYLELVMEPPSMEMNGKVTIGKWDIYEIFNIYKNSIAKDKEAMELIDEQIYVILSGKNSGIVEGTNDNNGNIITNKMNAITTIENTFDIFDKNYPHLINTSKKLRDMITELMDDKNKEELKKYIGDTSIYSEVSSKELSYIKPPNVLHKIWKIYNNKGIGVGMGIDDFFGIKFNVFDSVGRYYSFQKVSDIYNKLNTIGYYRDGGMHKRMRCFTSAFSDMGHASMASFTSRLFSCDKNFIKKTEAAYEYLGIETKIVNPDN